MKKLIFLALNIVVFTASSCKKEVNNSGTQATETSTLSAASRTMSPAILYISGSMHIESDAMKRPNVDSLESFFAAATTIGYVGSQTSGMKWSIGADIGWLNNEPRAAELIAYTEALGVEWDIHAHYLTDRPLCYQKIGILGGHPTGVCSGMQTSQIDSMRSTITNGTASFTATSFWGLTLASSHGTGSDLTYSGCWRPASSVRYLTAASSGPIYVGGYTRKITDADNLAKDMQTNPSMYPFPVTSATIMVDPITFCTPLTTDNLTAITAFANRVGAYSNVRWATINQTATAWSAAGGTNSRK